MKVLTVVGNRPQFVKVAAVSSYLREFGEEVLVHTGQHHDDRLSSIFFEELELAAPVHYLGISGGSNTDQTARMLLALEGLMVQERPDVVLVYGDTNSTLAGALAARQAGIPIAHVEAGMRSFDRAMPEELNRVLTDHMSTVLLCSTEEAKKNLVDEGLGERAEVVGDVMVDIARRLAPIAAGRTELLNRFGLRSKEFVLITAHRCGNVDDEQRLGRLVEIVTDLGEPAVFALHPRTQRRLSVTGLLTRLENANDLHLTEALSYLDFTALLQNSRAVLTDSGGVQKEAYLARVPCVTLRPSTEWVETVDSGWNVLVDLDRQHALASLRREPPTEYPQLYGDGQAGERVAAVLEREFRV